MVTDLLDNLCQLAPRGDTGFGEDVFSFAERHDRWEGLDAHDRRKVLLFVGVDGRKDDVMEIGGHIGEDWGKPSTCGAPWCPEFYDHCLVTLHGFTERGKRELSHAHLRDSRWRRCLVRDQSTGV